MTEEIKSVPQPFPQTELKLLISKCVHCGEPLWDNGTVAVHLKLIIHEGKPTVLQTQWCDASKKTIGETALASVPTESRQTETSSEIDWAERAAERIHLLYRDSNYFKSVPKEPLIHGWADVMRTEFFKSPPVMFGFKTVEEWEKFTRFAVSSALLPVGRPMCSECAGTKTMHDDNCPTLKPGWLERQSAVVNDNMKKLGELFPPALPVGRQLEHSDSWWWEVIQAAIAQWGGPQRKHFDEALARIKFVYDERLAGRDEFGDTIEEASLPVGESTPNDVKVLQELVEDYQKAVDGSGQHHLIAPEQVADRFRALRDLLREALPYIESGVKREVESPGSHQEFKDEAIDLLRRCKSASSKVGVGESREPLPTAEITMNIHGTKCGKPAALFIPRLGKSFACVLEPNHEGECRPGGRCTKHGPYVGQAQIPPQCPNWPDCIPDTHDGRRLQMVEGEPRMRTITLCNCHDINYLDCPNRKAAFDLDELHDQPSEPMSPAVVNSILDAKVPESNFLRDEPDLPSLPAEIESRECSGPFSDARDCPVHAKDVVRGRVDPLEEK